MSCRMETLMMDTDISDLLLTSWDKEVLSIWAKGDVHWNKANKIIPKAIQVDLSCLQEEEVEKIPSMMMHFQKHLVISREILGSYSLQLVFQRINHSSGENDHSSLQQWTHLYSKHHNKYNILSFYHLYWACIVITMVVAYLSKCHPFHWTIHFYSLNKLKLAFFVLNRTRPVLSIHLHTYLHTHTHHYTILYIYILYIWMHTQVYNYSQPCIHIAHTHPYPSIHSPPPHTYMFIVTCTHRWSDRRTRSQRISQMEPTGHAQRIYIKEVIVKTTAHD